MTGLEFVVCWVLAVAGRAIDDPVEAIAYPKSHERRELQAELIGHILNGIIIRDNQRFLALMLQFNCQSQDLLVSFGQEAYVAYHFRRLVNLGKRHV